MLSSATLSLNVHIILFYRFSGHSPSYVVCVCNHYRRTNQNRRSMMGLVSHLSCISDAVYSYFVSFSLVCLNWCHSTNYISLVNLTIMGLDPGPLVNLLVVLVTQALEILFRLGLNHLATLFRWLCLYQEELSPKLVDS